jgi:phosphotransferase system HPr (HPr) family protein
MIRREDTGVEADAKSILNVLYVAASQGVELQIITDGLDEGEAMTAVDELFVSGFGEI